MQYPLKKIARICCFVCAAVLATVLALPAAHAAPTHYPYRVVATIGMIGDVLQNVAGDKAQVTTIIGEGIDPHLYKPTRSDIITLGRADIIFYNGLLLEGKMADILVRSARLNKPVVAVTEAVLKDGGALTSGTDGGTLISGASGGALINEADGGTLISGASDGVLISEADGGADPHVWMDVGAWISVTRRIAAELAQFDPQNASTYAANAQSYTAQLERLDTYARQVLGSIPESQRVLVTAHDAFNYLGRAYGIQVRGIQGISTDSEAGVRDIEDLVAFLVENKIPAVFVESSVSDKNVRALVEGARARGHTVTIGGELYSDAMGAHGTYEGTYIGMIDHNVTTIANALGGKTPPGGFLRKLKEQPSTNAGK